MGPSGVWACPLVVTIGIIDDRLVAAKRARGDRSRRYWLMCQPPLGESTCPVTKPASSEAR
jgi:hypothetical protein